MLWGISPVHGLTGILSSKKYKTGEIESFKGHLNDFRKKRYRVKVAVEALTGVMFFTEEIRDCVDELVYVNANKFKNIRTRSSERNGGITKKGDSRTRSKIIQAVRALVNSKSDNSIKRFYKRLVKRGIEKNKALIAAARKLVKVIFTILLGRRKFVEFVDTECNLCAGG